MTCSPGGIRPSWPSYFGFLWGWRVVCRGSLDRYPLPRCLCLEGSPCRAILISCSARGGTGRSLLVSALDDSNEEPGATATFPAASCPALLARNGRPLDGRPGPGRAPLCWNVSAASTAGPLHLPTTCRGTDFVRSRPLSEVASEKDIWFVETAPLRGDDACAFVARPGGTSSKCLEDETATAGRIDNCQSGAVRLVRAGRRRCISPRPTRPLPSSPLCVRRLRTWGILASDAPSADPA